MATGMDQTRTPGSRIAGALEPETVAGGILVALEPVEHHNGWQLRQWSWRCMVPVANVQARGEGLLVDTMVSGQGFQAYLREPEYPTRLWRWGWTKPERQTGGLVVSAQSSKMLWIRKSTGSRIRSGGVCVPAKLTRGREAITMPTWYERLEAKIA